MTNALTQPNSLLSEVIEYVPAAELASRFSFCPSEFYIRGSVQDIDSEVVNRLKDDLVFSGNDGELPVVRINNPLTVFALDGKEYLLAGNTRTYAVEQMRNETKYSKMTFADVPFRRLQVEPTYETLIRLQIADNDTTNEHSTLEVAKIVENFWTKANEQALAAGKNAKQAAGIATQACVALTGKTVAYVGQLRNFLSFPEWLITHIENDRLNADTALNMVRFSQKSGMPLEAIFQGCESLAVGAKGIFKSHLDAFIKSVGKGQTEQTAATGEEDESGNAGEGGETRKPKNLVSADTAANRIEEVLSHYDALEPLEVNPLQYELLDKTAGSAAKILSSALKSQVIDVSKAAELLPTVSQTLTKLIGYSLISNLDSSAIAEMEDEEQKTEATKKAVSALRVAGNFIGQLFSEGLMSPDVAAESLDSIKSSFIGFFDSVELAKAYNPEELTAVYNQFQGLSKTLGLLSTDELSEDSVTDDDEDEYLEAQTAPDDAASGVLAENEEYTVTAE